jgi:hypothetical protein
MRNAVWNPLFDGYYGMQSTGDDAFCTISAWGAGRCWVARHIRFATSRLPSVPGLVAPLMPQAIFPEKLRFCGYVQSLFTLLYRSMHGVNPSGIVFAGGSTLLGVPLRKCILKG